LANISIDLIKIRENGIYVMIPAYAGQCFASFAKSLLHLSRVCALYNIPLDFFFILNESLIPRARNYCVDEFLRAQFILKNGDTEEKKNFQHAIFIDTDIEFDPMDVLLLAHLQNTNEDYDVICGPYPKKNISYEKLKIAVEKGLADEDPNKLEQYIGDFVLNITSGDGFRLDEPVEVHEAGTGFMMIRRETLLKISEKFPDIKYLPDHARSENFDGTREISAFFDTSIDPETKRYLSEDYHFNHLCRKAGLKTWICPWMQLKHHGYFIYGGSIGALAAAGLPLTVDRNAVRKDNKKSKKKR